MGVEDIAVSPKPVFLVDALHSNVQEAVKAVLVQGTFNALTARIAITPMTQIVIVLMAQDLALGQVALTQAPAVRTQVQPVLAPLPAAFPPTRVVVPLVFQFQ